MIYSMTGFGSDILILQQDTIKVKLTISIKSLNSRYFDASCKVPYIFGQFENEFIKLLKSKLHRGNITLVIHLDDQNAFKTSIQPSFETIKAYVNAAQQIQTELNIPGQLNINDFIRLQNIFILEEKGINESSKKIIFEMINKIIDIVLQERFKEGKEIEKDIKQRIEMMQKKINQIDALYTSGSQEEKEKIIKKIQDVKEQMPDLQHDSYFQMLQLTLEKIDIHEEISRFKSHLNNLLDVIHSANTETGKQLDFTLQELFRETNTIMAKSTNSQIIENAIGIKVEVEKLREQAQNIL